MLGHRILELAQQLLPDGRVTGREWRAHGPDGGKWGVVIRGDRIGKWQNFGAGQGGDSGLSLIRELCCEGDYRAAYTWALEWLGEDVHTPPPVPERPPEPPSMPGSDVVTGIKLFTAAEPFTWSGPAGQYLIGRGLKPELLPEQLGVLRFHPRIKNTDLDTYVPAMLAAIIEPVSGKHLALHRTYLECRDGRWRKLSTVEQAKKVLGGFRGGVIPLTKGGSKISLPKCPEGTAALMAEGIENALAVAQFFPELRALASISVGNLKLISLPAGISALMLVRDRDGVGNQAVTRTRAEAIERFLSEGRDLTQWEPPRGYKDAMDWCARLQQ